MNHFATCVDYYKYVEVGESCAATQWIYNDKYNTACHEQCAVTFLPFFCFWGWGRGRGMAQWGVFCLVSVLADQLERVKKETVKDEEEEEDCTLEHPGGAGHDD